MKVEVWMKEAFDVDENVNATTIRKGKQIKWIDEAVRAFLNS